MVAAASSLTSWTRSRRRARSSSLAIQVVGRVALELSAERGDPGVPVTTEPIVDELVGADEVGAKSDGSGHPAPSGLPVAGEPQLLDRPDVVAVALAGEGFVVEVGGG